jgi:hypothetical protein
VYGPRALWRGFRVPALIRFVGGALAGGLWAGREGDLVLPPTQAQLRGVPFPTHEPPLPPPPLSPQKTGEEAFLSPSNGGPVVYVNLEDHVSYATGRPNEEFQAVVSFLRTHPTCRGRLHW